MTLSTRTDGEIREELVAELRWALPELSTSLRADVLDGIVVLSGRCGATEARLRAERVAHDVPGVLDVVDSTGLLASGVPAAADLLLAHAVRRALEWDCSAPDESVKTTVSNGWVTLSGCVDRVRDSAEAERAVRSLVDARGVTNLLAVLPAGVAPGGLVAVLAHQAALA